MCVKLFKKFLLSGPLLILCIVSKLNFDIISEPHVIKDGNDFQKGENHLSKKWNSDLELRHHKEYMFEATTGEDIAAMNDQMSDMSDLDWMVHNKNSLQYWSTLYRPYHNFSQTVTSEMIDSFRVQLPPLLPNFKNPCWLESIPDGYSCNNTYFAACKRTVAFPNSPKPRIVRFCNNVDKFLSQRRTEGTKWRFRCFPYFFLLGVTKSGTTDLYDALFDNVLDAVPGALKEYHFWDAKRDPKSYLKCDVEPTLKFSTYMDAFDLAAEHIRTHGVKHGGEVYHTTITGDFTPSTLTNHPHWPARPGNEGCDVPRYTTAHYIHRIRPQTKFIIIMRDPVERFYSNFRMGIRLKRIGAQQSFDQEARNAVNAFEECARKLSDKACAYSPEVNTVITSMLISGLYTIFIDDWLKVFPPDQFLFLQTEHYKTHRFETIEKVVHFLHLDPLTDKQKAKVREDHDLLKLRTTESVLPIASKTKAMLQDFYRPYNKGLSLLIHNNNFTWGY